MIEELIKRVFTTQVKAKLFHWKTGSYAQHMAAGEFYDAVDGPLDDLVEDYQAAFTKVDSIKIEEFETEDDILSLLKKDVVWISKNRSRICEDVSSLENIIDELSSVYLKTIYKLENLS